MKTIQLKSEFLIKSGQLKNPMLIVHGNIGEEYLEVKPESKNN